MIKWLVVAFLIIFQTIAAAADLIDGELPGTASAPVKTSTRNLVHSGLEGKEAVGLTAAMLQHQFQPEEILQAHAIISAAMEKGLPAQPLTAKAFEGMAKNVPPTRIIGAMQTVQSRYARAFALAAGLTTQKSRISELGRVIASALAAELNAKHAAHLVHTLQQAAGRLNTAQGYALSLSSMETVQTMCRRGASSETATSVVELALSKGFNAQQMQAMQQSFMAQSQQHSPDRLAASYASAIGKGKNPLDAGFPNTAGSSGATQSPGAMDGSSAAGVGAGSAGEGSTGGGSGTGGPGSGGPGGGEAGGNR